MLRTLLIASLLLAGACGDGNTEGESYATFQACFDDHHVSESLSVHDSIVVCCIDHPIAGTAPSCGATAAECVAKLSSTTDTVHNLSPASATSLEVMTSCADYETEKSK